MQQLSLSSNADKQQEKEKDQLNVPGTQQYKQQHSEDLESPTLPPGAAQPPSPQQSQSPMQEEVPPLPQQKQTPQVQPFEQKSQDVCSKSQEVVNEETTEEVPPLTQSTPYSAKPNLRQNIFLPVSLILVLLLLPYLFLLIFIIHTFVSIIKLFSIILFLYFFHLLILILQFSSVKLIKLEKLIKENNK